MWLSGDTGTDAQGAYGMMGVPAADIYPGARYLHAMAIYGPNRAIYVHAGYTDTSNQLFRISLFVP